MPISRPALVFAFSMTLSWERSVLPAHFRSCRFFSPALLHFVHSFFLLPSPSRAGEALNAAYFLFFALSRGAADQG
jgi:hypothetical protein